MQDNPCAQAMTDLLKTLIRHRTNPALPEAMAGPNVFREWFVAYNPGALTKGGDKIGHREVTAPAAFLKIFNKLLIGPDCQKQLNKKTKDTNAARFGCAPLPAMLQNYLDATTAEARAKWEEAWNDGSSVTKGTKHPAMEIKAVLEIDAKGMFPQTKRTKSIFELAEGNQTDSLMLAAIYNYGTPTTVRYISDDDGSIDKRLVNEGGIIGDYIIQLMSINALANDMGMIKEHLQEADLWKETTAIAYADNIFYLAKLETLCEIINAVDTVEGLHYRYNEKNLLRPFALPTLLEDEVNEDLLPTEPEFGRMFRRMYNVVVPAEVQQDTKAWKIRTTALKILGVPIGTPAAVEEWLDQKAGYEERLHQGVTNIAGITAVESDVLIRTGISLRSNHLIAALPPHVVQKYAQRIDASYAKVITTIYNSAAQVPGQPGTDIHLDDYQRMVLFLRPTDTEGGHGYQSLQHLVQANVYLATQRGFFVLMDTMKLPCRTMIQAHLRGEYTMGTANKNKEAIQGWLDAVHAKVPEEQKASVAARIPQTADAWINSNSRKNTSKEVGKIVKRLANKWRINKFNQMVEARMEGQKSMAKKNTKGNVQDRVCTAWITRTTGTQGAQAVRNSRTTKSTRVTNQAYVINLATSMGLPPPGMHLLGHAECACSGKASPVDTTHIFGCSRYGRVYVHDAVKHTMAQLTHRHGGPNVHCDKVEPRGKDFYQDGGSKGPDIELTINGEKTYVDVTAIACDTPKHRRDFAKARFAHSQTQKKQLVRTISTAEDEAKTWNPMEARDNKKMKSEDARTAMANGAVYVPATFMHTGGMSHIMKKHIVTSFRHATPNMALQLNPDYKTVLNYATQTMTATIVNAKADYLIKNMRRLFQDNGLEGVELQWWGGATTFKETFTAEDSMTPAMDFQDSLDDIEQEPGTVDRAATAYDDAEDDDLTTTDDENDNGDEEGDEAERDDEGTGKGSDSGARDGGGASGVGGGVLGN